MPQLRGQLGVNKIRAIYACLLCHKKRTENLVQDMLHKLTACLLQYLSDVLHM